MSAPRALTTSTASSDSVRGHGEHVGAASGTSIAAALSTSASSSLGGGGIDNPDQRICDDVGSFVRSSVSLSLTVCRKIFSCVAFAGGSYGEYREWIMVSMGLDKRRIYESLELDLGQVLRRRSLRSMGCRLARSTPFYWKPV